MSPPKISRVELGLKAPRPNWQLTDFRQAIDEKGLIDDGFEGLGTGSGNKKEFDVQELETFASANAGNKQLVAVLKRGALVEGDETVKAVDINGIYVDKVDEFAPKAGKTVANAKPGSAELKGFSRNAISFDLKSAGTASITVMNTDGGVVATVVAENAKPGFNSVSWNADNIPSGRYTVTIEHNGTISGKNALLK